jgi:hypothetical protein
MTSDNMYDHFPTLEPVAEDDNYKAIRSNQQKVGKDRMKIKQKLYKIIPTRLSSSSPNGASYKSATRDEPG